MATVLDYLEEETRFIPDPDIPNALAKAELLQVVEAEFSFEVTRNRDDDEEYYDRSSYEEGTYPVLELTVKTDKGSTSFIVISPNGEEWLYFDNIDEFVDATYYENDDVSYNYEVISDDTL